ncbi:MAG: signal peptide peptidase SppA [Gemmatimonadota bacterium]|nr:signal peptide peptidase SppA [Gemmatimonadota bacterium]
MRRKIGRILAWIGGITVGLIALTVLSIVLLSGEDPVPDQVILEINLEQGVAEYVPEDPFAKLISDDVRSLRDVVGALDAAALDDRVVGLLARGGGAPMGFAQAQEIRDAVLDFGKSGKPTAIFAETFGEFGSGNVGYYLATAFEHIYLQPSGDVGLIGLAMEHPFVKGTLDSLGIGVQMDHRYEYKNAMNLYTETEFTDAHREASEVLLKSMVDQMVLGISQGRDTTPEAVRDLINRGPFLALSAHAEGLVDSLAYWDEVRDLVKREHGEDTKWLDIKNYLKRIDEKPYGEGTKVALIYGVGPVLRGKSAYDPLYGSATMGASTLTKAFRDAVKDKDVRAILFRIDSPGGSYVASDAIWREVAKAKKADKPVVVSMGNVAGSGGYFVAMNADKIVAQPGSITGSIGVLAGKFVTTEFWERLGITWDTAQVGENALIWGSGTEFTPEQWAKFQTWLDRIYEDFTAKVAEGRDMSQADVHAVAKGRIWTGKDAKAHGLVDELGGMKTAMSLVREALELDADTSLNLVVFPKEKTLIEQVMEKGLIRMLSNDDALVRLATELQPVFRFVHTVGLPRQVLEMAPMNIR